MYLRQLNQANIPTITKIDITQTTIQQAHNLAPWKQQSSDSVNGLSSGLAIDNQTTLLRSSQDKERREKSNKQKLINLRRRLTFDEIIESEGNEN
jgi:hypothetical protein